MKSIKSPNTRMHVGAIIAVVGLTTCSLMQAQDPKNTPQSTEAEKDDSKIKIKPNKVKIKGQAARELLKPEVTSAWVKGYTVPQEYHQHFVEVPAVQESNVVVRYYGGRAYYVNENDWKIVRVVDIDPSVEVTTDTSAFVEGYAIPETYRTRFVEVPSADTGLTVRYYNNTAYYMDPEYRIVRTVPLAAR